MKDIVLIVGKINGEKIGVDITDKNMTIGDANEIFEELENVYEDLCVQAVKEIPQDVTLLESIEAFKNNK